MRLAKAGNATALIGVGAIPAPEATRALIDLLGHADRAVARAAAQTLAMRMPDPALDGALGPRSPFRNDLQDPGDTFEMSVGAASSRLTFVLRHDDCSSPPTSRTSSKGRS